MVGGRRHSGRRRWELGFASSRVGKECVGDESRFHHVEGSHRTYEECELVVVSLCAMVNLGNKGLRVGP